MKYLIPKGTPIYPYWEHPYYATKLNRDYIVEDTHIFHKRKKNRSLSFIKFPKKIGPKNGFYIRYFQYKVQNKEIQIIP